MTVENKENIKPAILKDNTWGGNKKFYSDNNFELEVVLSEWFAQQSALNVPIRKWSFT